MALVSSYKVMGLSKSIYMHKTTLNGTFNQYSTRATVISSNKCIQFILEGLLEAVYVYR